MPSKRGESWLNAGAVRLSKCSYDGYFADLSNRCSMRKRAIDEDSGQEILKVTATDIVKPSIAALISKDVPRSWSGLPQYDTPQNRADLTEVLLCFSVHCPRVGYTQGMSFICALALTEMEKEWAFWLLIYIVRSLPWNFFHETAQLEVTLFMDIIENHAPIIKSHFDEDDMELAINYYLVPCFVPLFVYVLPVETTMRVWDLIFERVKYGDEIILTLHRIAFALLEIHSGTLLSENFQCRQAYKKALDATGIHTPHEVLHYYAQKVEETSGILFVRRVLEQGKQDSNADRLIQIASELTIHSDWLLNNRLRMSGDYDRDISARIIQRVYRKHYRRRNNTQRLRALKELRSSMKSQVSADDGRFEQKQRNEAANSMERILQSNTNGTNVDATDKEYCTIS